MPASIAMFMKQAHDEDKYGSEFIAGIDARVVEMNATQLRGLYNHLKKTARGATLEYWKDANNKLISHIEGLMREKELAIAKERKKEEEAWAAERAKDRQKKMRAEANVNAVLMIEKQAREKAMEEVKEAERKRQVEERAEIFLKTIAADVKKERVWFRTAVVYVFSVAIICVVAVMFLTSVAALLIGAGVAICTIAAGWIAYRYYKMAIILPLVVTEKDLEEQIDKRHEDLKLKGLEEKRIKDKLYKAAAAQEKIERKERVRLAKEKKLQEEKLMAERAAEQTKALEQMSAAGLSISDLLSGGGSSSIMSGAASLAPTRPGSFIVGNSEAPEIGAFTGPSSDGSIRLRFLSVEVLNVPLQASSSMKEGEWDCKISSDDFFWVAPCVKNDGVNLLFKTVLASLKTSTPCLLHSNQLVRVEVLRRRVGGGDSRSDSVLPPPRAEGKDSTTDHDDDDRDGDLRFGAFEATSEDFSAVAFAGSAAAATGALAAASRRERGEETKEQQELQVQEKAEEEEAAGGQEGQVVALRGVLLGAAYQRVADVAISVLLLPSEEEEQQ